MSQRAQTLRSVLLQLESVLCDPEGEVSIAGSPGDLFEVKTALARLAGVIEAEEAICEQPQSYQARVGAWMLACFGAEISADVQERNYRFLEESLELVQSLGCTQEAAHQLVDYVFGRPLGHPPQEVGGVAVTLAALCNAQNIDSRAAAEEELTRIWTKVEQIRAKQAGKPKHSPLPQTAISHTAQLEALQARIDELMIEYCPEDMTDAQRENWARHQRPVSKEEAAEINAILNKD